MAFCAQAVDGEPPLPNITLLLSRGQLEPTPVQSEYPEETHTLRGERATLFC